jgi:D-alanyl-D-alanine carboxypeptidase
MKHGVLAFLLVATTASASQAQSINPTEIDSLVSKVMAEKHLVGLSVGIMQNGQLVFAKGYGLRSKATGAPVIPETMFAIGSVSKQFTCASAFLLQQSHSLSLADRVAKYRPGLTRAKDISLLDLGQHVSGYRDYYPLDYVDRRMSRNRAADSIINEYGRQPLDFEPGSRYSYSNTGYLILGRILEQVAGMPLGQFMQQRLIGPLKLTHTKFEPARGGADMAEGYTGFSLGDPTVAVPEGSGWLGSAGGLWSTPTDLLSWDLALMDGKVLSPASWRTMTTPRRLSDGRSSGYGCGLGIRDRGPALVLAHTGAVSGYNAWNVMVPATRSGAVLLANMDFAPMGELQGEILNMLLPAAGQVPVVAGPPVGDVVRSLIDQFRSGTVDRSHLAPEWNTYLTPERLASAKAAMSALGEPKDIILNDRWERGGLEVTDWLFKLGETPVEALLYRRVDGTVEEFLVYWP